MIDYSEGITELQKMVKDVYEAMLHKDFESAMELCNKIAAEARLVRSQIQVQQERENGVSEMQRKDVDTQDVLHQAPTHLHSVRLSVLHNGNNR